jgi:hypothetical protein
MIRLRGAGVTVDAAWIVLVWIGLLALLTLIWSTRWVRGAQL